MNKTMPSGGWMAVSHEHLPVSSVAPLVASGLQFLTGQENVELFWFQLACAFEKIGKLGTILFMAPHIQATQDCLLVSIGTETC